MQASRSVHVIEQPIEDTSMFAVVALGAVMGRLKRGEATAGSGRSSPLRSPRASRPSLSSLTSSRLRSYLMKIAHALSVAALAAGMLLAPQAHAQDSRTVTL